MTTDAPDLAVSQSNWRWILILSLVMLPAYRHSFVTPFVFDDFQHIVQNTRIQSLQPLSRVLDWHGRPVISLTLAVNYAISAGRSWSYHIFNFGIHLAASLALFGLARRSLMTTRWSTAATPLAFCISLFWALHPLQTQSVTYVIQRCESLMGLFFLLFLYFLARCGQARVAWPWDVAAVVCCWLGMGCKEVMATAPLVGLLYDRAFLASSWKEAWRRRGLVHAMSFAAAAALVGYVVWLRQDNQNATMGFGIKHITPWQYLRTQPEVILHYLRLAVWPDVLCIDYAWRVENSPWRIYGLGLAILTLLAASVVAWLKWPKLGFLGLSFFIILAPTSSFLPIKDVAFEHRMYLPLACVISLGVVGGQAALCRAIRDDWWRQRAAVLLFTVITTALWLRTSERNRDYLDPVRLWSKAAQVAPHNARAYANWGASLQRRKARSPADEKKKHEQALKKILHSLKLREKNAITHALAGVSYAALGENEQAERHYRRALEIHAKETTALFNYGNLLARQERFEAAIEQYQRLLKIEPRHVQAQKNLEEARQLLEKSKGKSDTQSGVEPPQSKVPPSN